MITAENIAKALGGHKTGGGWLARCPAHDDTTPSLSISLASDDKLLVHCFAGCDQPEVIDALRDRGLWPTRGGQNGKIIRPQPSQFLSHQYDRDDAGRTARALPIWHRARPGAG